MIEITSQQAEKTLVFFTAIFLIFGLLISVLSLSPLNLALIAIGIAYISLAITAHISWISAKALESL